MIRPLVYVVDYSYALRLRMFGWLHVRDDYLGGEKAPIVLLPGVYEPWTFLRPLAEHLHSAGHPVHVVRALGRNTRPIPLSASIVQRYLVERDLTGVTLIAHSKGGLIGKHMMIVDDTDARIDRLIAIATPFAGSSYARYFVNRPLRAFIPTDATLTMLAADALANVRITSIYGSWDTHIPEGSELAGATNIEVPIPGHFRIVGDRQVFAAIDSVLGD